MPVTLSVPPKVVRDVESFAARSGTTLDALVLAYLVKTATEERRTRSKRSRNPVLKFCGILPKGEAERMRAVVSEQSDKLALFHSERYIIKHTSDIFAI